MMKHNHNTTNIVILALAILSIFFTFDSCTGEDRSGEQPFAPTVNTVSATANANSAILQGLVTASPNSSLLACGFKYGNDTITQTIESETVQNQFSVTIDSLAEGKYYIVAFAKNGIGISLGDTLWLTINKP